MHHEETTFEALSLAELDTMVGGSGDHALREPPNNDTLSVSTTPVPIRVKIKHNI